MAYSSTGDTSQALQNGNQVTDSDTCHHHKCIVPPCTSIKTACSVFLTYVEVVVVVEKSYKKGIIITIFSIYRSQLTNSLIGRQRLVLQAKQQKDQEVSEKKGE